MMAEIFQDAGGWVANDVLDVQVRFRSLVIAVLLKTPEDS